MDFPSLAFCLITYFFSVQGQLPVNVLLSVNGRITTDPVFLYHDEITFTSEAPTLDNMNSSGSVVCLSNNHHRAHWSSPSGIFLKTELANYKQLQSLGDSLPSLSRLSSPDDGDIPRFFASGYGSVIVNGLWTCQVDNSDLSDEDIIGSFKYVGVYTRGNGRGAITTITDISLVDPNFMGDSLSFTLICETSGGPPANYSWRRFGEVIRDGGPYKISHEVIGINTTDLQSVYIRQILQKIPYRTTLTVTGYLPGVYLYSALNPVMTSSLTASFDIQGGVVNDLTAVQSDVNTILITWTILPSVREFQLRLLSPRGSTSTYSGESPYMYTSAVFGVYTIEERIPSIHFVPRAKTNVTVREHGPSMIRLSLLTSILAIISWSPMPPKFHLPIVMYTVTLTQVTGSDPRQELCPEFVDNRPTIRTTATSMSFTGLEEFSTYTVTLTTTFDVFGRNMDEVTPELMFTTHSSAPTGVPRDVTAAITSRNITVTWDTIECIERNGIILRYIVDTDIPSGSTSGRTYSAGGLIPNTQFTFRVAGVNDADTGPFTRTLVITTSEEVPGPVSDLRVLAKFISVDLTWSAPKDYPGVIISYEVTYRVTGVTLIINTTDISTSFNISSLPPRTTVSGISVSAYTKVGRGEASTIPDQITLGNSIVEKVKIKTLSPTAVRVSWKSVLGIPEMIGYIVYYTGDLKRRNISVNSSVTSVDIEGLLKNVKYQYQVAVLAKVNGQEIIGELAIPPTRLRFLDSCSRNCEIVVGVIFSYLVVILLASIVLFYRLRAWRTKNTSKSRIDDQNPDINLPHATLKIDDNEKLKHNQNPDINQQQTINSRSESMGSINQQQTKDFKIDPNETSEHEQNPDINQQQTTDSSIDDDEASECDQNSDDINQNDENDYGDNSNN